MSKAMKSRRQKINSDLGLTIHGSRSQNLQNLAQVGLTQKQEEQRPPINACQGQASITAHENQLSSNKVKVNLGSGQKKRGKKST
jgi:hypothetical protein